MTAYFTAGNNQILDPSGKPFKACGIGVIDNAITSQTASQILSEFPGLNMVRLAIEYLQTPLSSTIQNFIQQMTNAGVVVEIEDHTAPSVGGNITNNVPSGTALTNELNWYSSLAKQYINNPLIWFGTMNEPGDNADQSQVSAQEVAIYNAIRGTGNNTPIMLEIIGGSYTDGLVVSDYSTMTNVIWDIHHYGWWSNYSTDQTTVNNALASMASSAQAITSANGKVPVIIGESGPSSTGSSIDPNWNQVFAADQQSGFGVLFWAIGGDGTVQNDSLNNPDGTLNSYGQQVAPYIKNTGVLADITPPATSSPPPSTGGTTGGSTGGTTGNVLPISQLLQLFADGQSAATINPLDVRDIISTIQSMSGVTSVSGRSGPIVLYSSDIVDFQGGVATTIGSATGAQYTKLGTTDMVLAKSGGVLGWVSYSTLSNLLGSVAFTGKSSPDKTLITTVGPSIVDSNGNTWSLNLLQQVVINGVADTTTTHAIALAYVSQKIWYENSAFTWQYKILPTDTWSGSTTLNPLASPDKTVVTTTGPIITDNAGNAWSLSSGAQVVVNGAADSTTSNVTEIAYVSQNIWQKNTSNLWWYKTSPTASWQPPAGTSTAPL